MGLFKTTKIQDATVGIWKIEEATEDLHRRASLTASEQAFYTTLQSPLRRKHWLSYRLILPHLLDPASASGISYDQYGKPYLDNAQGHISVAHSGVYSALIISRNKAVGIDIESIHEKIFKLTHKFLSDKEQGYNFNDNALESLYLIWCAKEALYKLHGKRGLSFREHLHIDPFEFKGSGELTGYIRKAGSGLRHSLFYECFNRYMLVYVIGQ